MTCQPRKWTLPDSYMGAHWDGYYGSGFGQHRDSDSIERSNFTVMCAAMDALPAWEGADDSRIVVRESHWAVGWVEWFAIHETDTAALALARELCDKANDYPLLDEDHHSDLEWEEVTNYWARMSVRDRLEAIRESGASVSPFAARHDYMPSDDCGRLFDWVRG